MTRLLFAIPGDPSARSGGYEYDRRILRAAPAQGMETKPIALPGSFPDPSHEDVSKAVERINAQAQRGDIVLIDGLAAGALPEEALRAIAAPFIELCHHPLCLETGLVPARADELRATEIRALSLAAHVVATSAHTSAVLRHQFGVSAEKITIAPPGTERAPRARGTNCPITLLAVGALIPRKGFDILINALAELVDLHWRFDIVGSRENAPETTAALEALIETKGLGSRIALPGELSDDALETLYDKADIFVSSSLYEGYGMALAEAVAHGLPIVMSTGGAAHGTVADDAALKVPPGAAAPLRAALRKLIVDGSARQQLSDAAWRATEGLPSWENTAKLILEAARRVAAVMS